MSTAELKPKSDESRRLRLRGIDWPSYRKISEALAGRHVRLTYDRGTTTSPFLLTSALTLIATGSVDGARSTRGVIHGQSGLPLG